MTKAFETVSQSGNAAQAPTSRGPRAGAAAVLVAASAPGAAHTAVEATIGNDAELLAACDKFQAAHARRSYIDSMGAPSDELGEEFDDECDDALDTVTGLRAETAAGLKARAGVALVALRHSIKACVSLTWEEQANFYERLALDCLAQMSGQIGPTISVPPIAVTDHPDAELLALAAEAAQLEHRCNSLYWATDELDDRYGTPEQVAAALEFAAVDPAHDAAFARLGEMHAQTVEGLRAKARAVVVFYGEDPPSNDGAAGPAMWSIIEHLAGKGAVESAPTRRRQYAGASLMLAGAPVAAVRTSDRRQNGNSPDADLLAMCAEFEKLELQVRRIYDDSTVSGGEAERQARPLQDRLDTLVENLAAVHAKSDAGLRARVGLLAVHNSDGGFSWDDPATVAGRLLSLAMRDAVSLSSGGA